MQSNELTRFPASSRETLNFFQNRISDAIKQEIDTYFRENEYTLRNEVSILGDYYKSTSGDYEAHLVAKDRGISLVDITLSVPDETTAAAICDNWQKKNQEIYQYLIQELFATGRTGGCRQQRPP